MTEEKIREIENKCRIKSKEQFIEECRKAGFPDDWYAFTCDRSKPVSIDEDSVYYRKIGITRFTVLMSRWDTAFEELVKYKKERDWEKSGEPYRIDKIGYETDADIAFSSGKGYVTIRGVRFTDHPEQEMLDDGWIYDNYDHYMGYSNYHKEVSLGNIKKWIVIEFTKMTDDRDRREFGFTDVSIRGSFHYPVPEDMIDYVAKYISNNDPFPEHIKTALRRRLCNNLLEDEFRDLRRLRDTHKNALLAAVDLSLSEDEQKDALAKAWNRAEQGNPAVDNFYGSRSYLVTHKNYDLVFDAIKAAKSAAPEEVGGDYAVYRDEHYILGIKGGEPYLVADGKKYRLSCHPYEPCLYITDGNGSVDTVHNAFDPLHVAEAFSEGRTVSSITGREYDAKDFCRMVGYAAGKGNINIDDAEKVFKECPAEGPGSAEDVIAQYPRLVIDYFITGAEHKYEGWKIHWRALVQACRKLFFEDGEAQFHFDTFKAAARKMDAEWLFAPIPEDDSLNYRKAFLQPPQYSSYTDADFDRVNAALFPNGTDALEVFDWTTDWSEYFDDGHEWWGALCVTVYDASLDRMVVIMASATD